MATNTSAVKNILVLKEQQHSEITEEDIPPLFLTSACSMLIPTHETAIDDNQNNI